MTWTHIDLFSGIGGFAYAFKEVFGEEGEIELFCDNDRFCQEVLKKRFPGVPIWGDIRELIAHTKEQRLEGSKQEQKTQHSGWNSKSVAHTKCFSLGWKRGNPEEALGQEKTENVKGGKTTILNTTSYKNTRTILTGGFPCQPFSQAGKRRGTSDNRYLWSEMLECIRLFKPTWVIAENVYGLVSWSGGMVLKQVYSDLEKEGYKIGGYIISACSKNAPHRRDRIWIVATNSKHNGRTETKKQRKLNGEARKTQTRKELCNLQSQGKNSLWNDTNSKCLGWEKRSRKGIQSQEQVTERQNFGNSSSERWNAHWTQIATKLCRVDDGLPARVDGFELSKSKHRQERLKSLGNAIVPQVAMEIMMSIKRFETNSKVKGEESD